jgi:AraC-like DNA-binding protein
MPFRQKQPATSGRSSETPIRAERFRADLQPRSLGLAGLDEGENFRAIHLERGEATLRTRDAPPLPLAGPVMGWFPWRDGMRLELAAGAQGSHLLLGRTTLNRTLAGSPETAELRFMADRRLLLRLAGEDSPGAIVAGCFAGILAETLRPGPLSAPVVESFLRVLLVHLRRGQAQGGVTAPAAGGGTALASRFTALVEGHVRERWTVARYAAELCISRDRLNDVCLRAHGRPPGRLIRERLLLEARAYLEQSSLAIEQIAGVLGFSGAPQFNRFFSEMTGLPPGRYRNRHRDAAEPGPQDRAALYSWP